MEEELDGVFDAIDDGETVRIDELQNKQDRAWLSCAAVAFVAFRRGRSYGTCCRRFASHRRGSPF